VILIFAGGKLYSEKLKKSVSSHKEPVKIIEKTNRKEF
jgi:hypothetical protein